MGYTTGCKKWVKLSFELPLLVVSDAFSRRQDVRTSVAD